MRLARLIEAALGFLLNLLWSGLDGSCFLCIPRHADGRRIHSVHVALGPCRIHAASEALPYRWAFSSSTIFSIYSHEVHVRTLATEAISTANARFGWPLVLPPRRGNKSRSESHG
jgi:hypothetical protein